MSHFLFKSNDLKFILKIKKIFFIFKILSYILKKCLNQNIVCLWNMS